MRHLSRMRQRMGVETVGGRWYHSSFAGTSTPVAACAAWRMSEMPRMASGLTSHGLAAGPRGQIAMPGKRCPKPARATACSFCAMRSLRVAATVKIWS